MYFLGVLCLAACALAQPAVYVSRTTLDYPHYYMGARMIALAPETEDATKIKEMIISGVPEAPRLLPLGSIVLEPAKAKDDEEEPKAKSIIEPNKDEEPMEDEDKDEEEPKEEKEKEEEMKINEDGPHVPVVLRFKPPQFITDYINSLPISIPPNFPILGPIFNKPPTEGTDATPVEIHKYRFAYAPIMSGAPIALDAAPLALSATPLALNAPLAIEPASLTPVAELAKK